MLLSRLATADAPRPSGVSSPVAASGTRLPSATATATAAVSRRTEGLVPYSVVKDYLSDHPVMERSRLSPEDVHAVIVRFHTEDVHEVEGGAPKANRCESCDGTLQIDSKEGMCVCSSCGIVQQERMNLHEEFRAPPVLTKKRGQYGVRGVPSWMLKRHVVRSYVEDLEHWNAYVHLGTDEVASCNEMLMRMRGEARTVHLVSVLVYMALRERLPNEKQIRSHLLQKRELTSVRVARPEAEFACGTCDERHNSRKSARFCCKHELGKRGRPN